MLQSSRVKEMADSLTLKVNAKAVQLAEQGRHIYNLSAGQLPFRPMAEFIDQLREELNFLKSYQYSPVAGFKDLRDKLVKHMEQSRGLDFSNLEKPMDCIITTGGKQAIFNALGAMVDPGDEVVIFAPYWVSYPEIIKFWGGVPVVVQSNIYNGFNPPIEDLARVLSPKTRAVILNSPANPTGTHYPESWMKDFGALMKDYPNITILSDEIYYEVSYFDPSPTYFYQEYPELLERTVFVDGISKALASTGLRIGWTVGPQDLIKAMTKMQSQSTSGANSLVQRALINYDFSKTQEYLEPVKNHLRNNSRILREKLRQANLAHCWYQPLSAFYYLIDFSKSPVISRYTKEEGDKTDYSMEICEEILEEFGVALVPGIAFGSPNTARMSLVLEEDPFTEAVEMIVRYMKGERAEG